MSHQSDGDIQTATIEIDVPKSASPPPTESLSSDDVESLERERLKHKKLIDRWGFGLLVGSIILYFVMYLIEKFAGTGGAVSGEMSKFTSTVSETMKFLISSLIGYLFANRT
jgi:hypothetical protein